MTKKHFIALANVIQEHNSKANAHLPFTNSHIESLADFCQAQNPQFNQARWLAYIAGECGPNGGTVKKA